MDTPGKNPDSELSDAELIDAVRRAVHDGVGPADVEAFVGQKAWINTTREPDATAMKMVDIGPDEESGTDLPRLRDARDVVYWGRPLESHDPRLAGIAWNNDGTAEIFFGVLYPP
jgi:hypothetical protein